MNVVIRKKTGFALAAIVPLILTFLTGTVNANAATHVPHSPNAGHGDGCNPGRANDYPDNNLFDGWYRIPGGTVGGVYSNIYNYSPWVHYISSTASAVVAWTMVTRNDASVWAQVGWLEYPVGKRYTFDQTFNGSGQPRTEMYAPDGVNTSSYYTTLYNNPSGDFGFYKDGKLIDSTHAAWTPNEGQNFGEAKSTADQMAGGYQNPETFGDTHIYYSGGWHSFNGTSAMTKSYYGGLKIDAYTMQIWDDACRA
jgi:hypothetical protein